MSAPPGSSGKREKRGAASAGQAKWKLLLLAVIVALLVLLFDFTAIGGL